MKDFADYTPTNEGEELMAEAQEALRGVRGMSDAQLLKEIYARAVESKRKGTLTNEQIDQFFAQLSPMLDPLRRRRLKKLIDDLKRL